MPAIVENSAVEECLRKLLQNEGYRLNALRSYGETGVDIIARREGEEWHIEVIAYKSSPPARAKDFYEAFFRVVSRLNDGAQHCVIALAEQARTGLPARARQHGVAWDRLSEAFPELEIWLVDVSSSKYERTSWSEWLR